MAVLIIGLTAAGAVSLPILKTVLESNLNDTVRDYAQSNMVERLLTWRVDQGRLNIFPIEPQPRTDYIVAIYYGDGALAASAGGLGVEESQPMLPASIKLDDAYITQGEIFALEAPDGSVYHGTVVVDTISAGTFDQTTTQLVAVPLFDVDRFVASYLAVFTLVAILIVIAGALGTRWLVTLTFRRLLQVEQTAMEIAAGDFSQRMTDIVPTTEIGRVKGALNAMLDRIDGALDERDATLAQMRRFVGDASHELRTPLVSVRGYAELYRMGALADEEATAKAMERIEAEAKRMGVLVEDLLALTRLEESREMQMVPVDLRPIARDAALDVRAAEPQREVSSFDHTFEPLTRPIDLPINGETNESANSDGDAGPRSDRPSAARRAGNALRRWRRRPQPEVAPLDVSEPAPAKPITMPPVVVGDENRIRQVIANLVGNARRYSPSDAPIGLEVGVDPETDRGWIAVVDHGEGVPEAIRAKIFERFWRADTSRARETGGSGLGLAIVDSIVTALDGSVTVDETPGGGATFTVWLDLAPHSTDADDESSPTADEGESPAANS